MTVPELSGRSLESLQAETDLLAAQERLNDAERYMLDAMSLQVILTSLANAYKDHEYFLRNVVGEAENIAKRAGHAVDSAKKELELAKTEWESQ